jgi:hypothetical protein
MDTRNTTGTFRGLTVGTLFFGALGVGLYWWVPMGMVMSLVGLMSGVVDWTLARQRSLDSRLAVAGIVLSVAALALNIVVAALGWQAVTFGGQ